MAKIFKIPGSLRHSAQEQGHGLGETIILFAGEGPDQGAAVGTIWNAEDFGFPPRTEDVEAMAVAFADKVVRAYNSLDGLILALQPFADQPVADDAPCHFNLTTKEKCGRCSRILGARAALDKAKGEPNATS